MKKNPKGRISMADYVKAIKQANREMELENSTGFKAVTKIHKSKKSYDRREGKKIDFDTLPFFMSMLKIFHLLPKWEFDCIFVSKKGESYS